MAIIFIFYKRVAVKSFILIYLLTGLAVWLFARSVFHIGASGVVYGLVSFVFWTGVFRRNLKSIVLSLIILVMYSGYFLGIVPGQEGISWESHLYGGVVGILIAYLFKDRVEADEIPETYIDEPEADDYFLRRDIFEKTINERQNESQGNWWESDQTF
jgi:membrane associated rhomboid family serine protease